jgi:2-oxoglutarate ferredoxin oxidoreductase subunit beta
MEAMAANATFVARSFAGDPKQVKELIKAAFRHHGIAVIDIISPCVTFHNLDNTLHSYTWGKDHEAPLHDISYIPARDEITIEDFEDGTVREIALHDGSKILLKKLDKDHDPTNRKAAFSLLADAELNNWLITGLIYLDPDYPSLFEMYDLPEEPLNRMKEDQIRPSWESLKYLNETML